MKRTGSNIWLENRRWKKDERGIKGDGGRKKGNPDGGKSPSGKAPDYVSPIDLCNNMPPGQRKPPLDLTSIEPRDELLLYNQMFELSVYRKFFSSSCCA